mmetsp:Transcript_37919/g.55895  ORF Transcript_37919/g.55895 Transcript_37919/m.55895 type:complete len:295 (+) Transcript_37919:57-941(+)
MMGKQIGYSKGSAGATATSLLLIWVLNIASTSNVVHASPMIAEVDPVSEKCFKYIVPPDDDANMVFMAISSQEEYVVEDHFLTVVQTTCEGLAEGKKQEAMSNVVGEDIPEKVRGKIKRNSGASGVFLKIQKPGKPPLRNQMMMLNAPIIIRNVVKTAGGSGQGWNAPLGGFEVCFSYPNDKRDDEDFVKVLFDMDLLNDDDDDEKKKEKHKDVIKKDHVTPVEMNLEDAIDIAEDILDEFKYMEKRERRMRETAQSTNGRVKYFSYLSIAILLSVTYVQVTYLKSYFKKKKLM